MATEDDRTSEICRSLDGKKFRINEAKAGVNYPPMHPNCRSTTIECIPDEENTMSSEAVPDITYENWKKKYTKQALTDADDDGRIKTRKIIKTGIQLFAESDIEKQESVSLKRAIRKYQKRIEEHEKKIINPEKYISDWANYDERKQYGLKNTGEKK